MIGVKRLGTGSLVFCLGIVVVFCSIGDESRAQKQISFSQSIEPFITSRCVQCHFGGRAAFDIHPGKAYQDLQPLLRQGKAEGSLLYRKLQEGHPLLAPLDGQQLGMLKAWIDQGAPDN